MSGDTIILFTSSWRTTNKLQLGLINVLIKSILNAKVLQGSVSTRLRCDGIYNDQFITQSLLSPNVKKNWKSINIRRSYDKLSRGSFFYETVYIVTYNLHRLLVVRITLTVRRQRKYVWLVLWLWNWTRRCCFGFRSKSSQIVDRWRCRGSASLSSLPQRLRLTSDHALRLILKKQLTYFI